MADWQRILDDETGDVYYFNSVTNESKWTPPPVRFFYFCFCQGQNCLMVDLQNNNNCRPLFVEILGRSWHGASTQMTKGKYTISIQSQTYPHTNDHPTWSNWSHCQN